MQIRQLFGFCGGVIGIDRVGEQQQFVFIEYTYPAVSATLLLALPDRCMLSPCP